LPDSKETQEFFSTEWQECRGIVDKLDTQLATLRQAGFSFITALLAGTSVLYQVSSTVTPTVKLAVIVVTFMLIDALYATDCYFRVIQKVAARKAEMLEDKLEDKDGITHVIARAYAVTKDWFFIDVLYYVFLLAAASLGLVLLPLFHWQWFVVILFFACSLAAVVLMDRVPAEVNLKPKEQLSSS
jgi:hypothetical protein